jgi:hypothetical protein
LVLQDSWGLGVGLTTPPRKIIIVTEPSKKEGRPNPTPGCSAEEEEKYYCYLEICFTSLTSKLKKNERNW